MDNFSLQGLTNKINTIHQNVNRTATPITTQPNQFTAPTTNNTHVQTQPPANPTNSPPTSIANQPTLFSQIQQNTTNTNLAAMMANISQNMSLAGFVQTFLPGLIRPSVTLQDDKLHLFAKENENRKLVSDAEGFGKKVEQTENQGSEASREKVIIKRKSEGMPFKNLFTRVDVLLYRAFHHQLQNMEKHINTLFYKLPIFSHLRLADKIAFSRTSLIFEKAIITFSVLLTILITLAVTSGIISLSNLEIDFPLKIVLGLLTSTVAGVIGYIAGLIIVKAINLLRTLIILKKH